VTNNNGFWIGWLDLLTPSICNLPSSQSIIANLPTSQITRTRPILFLLLWLTVLSEWLLLYSLGSDHSTENTAPVLMAACIPRYPAMVAAPTTENTAALLLAACVLRALPSNRSVHHNINARNKETTRVLDICLTLLCICLNLFLSTEMKSFYCAHSLREQTSLRT
jgi:hypothetical protein